jgi:hypothetical protein
VETPRDQGDQMRQWTSGKQRSTKKSPNKKKNFVKKPEQQVIAVKTAQPLIGNIISNAPRTQIGFQINVKNLSPDIKPTSNLQVIS